jgi:hypothetical protein
LQELAHMYNIMHTSAYEYVSIRQHTSAYDLQELAHMYNIALLHSAGYTVTFRPPDVLIQRPELHTSAKHTSGHVSIRQHT